MLIYSTSKVNPLNAKIISDLKDIPEEYYENIINLINGFKYGTLPNGSIKMLKNNENLKAVIKYAYSPDINFGDNVVENIINLPESNTLDDVYSVWYMLDKLASNNTNSYIKQEFKDYMAFFPDIEELITGIITKDLNLGMSIVSINKILKVLDLDSSQLAISNWFHK